MHWPNNTSIHLPKEVSPAMAYVPSVTAKVRYPNASPADRMCSGQKAIKEEKKYIAKNKAVKFWHLW